MHLKFVTLLFVVLITTFYNLKACVVIIPAKYLKYNRRKQTSLPFGSKFKLLLLEYVHALYGYKCAHYINRSSSEANVMSTQLG